MQNKPTSKTTNTTKESADINAILRTVASSSAIESNLSVEAIEEKLKSGKSRFSHLKLAL